MFANIHWSHCFPANFEEFSSSDSFASCIRVASESHYRQCLSCLWSNGQLSKLDEKCKKSPISSIEKLIWGAYRAPVGSLSFLQNTFIAWDHNPMEVLSAKREPSMDRSNFFLPNWVRRTELPNWIVVTIAALCQHTLSWRKFLPEHTSDKQFIIRMNGDSNARPSRLC